MPPKTARRRRLAPATWSAAPRPPSFALKRCPVRTLVHATQDPSAEGATRSALHTAADAPDVVDAEGGFDDTTAPTAPLELVKAVAWRGYAQVATTSADAVDWLRSHSLRPGHIDAIVASYIESPKQLEYGSDGWTVEECMAHLRHARRFDDRADQSERYIAQRLARALDAAAVARRAAAALVEGGGGGLDEEVGVDVAAWFAEMKENLRDRVYVRVIYRDQSVRESDEYPGKAVDGGKQPYIAVRIGDVLEYKDKKTSRYLDDRLPGGGMDVTRYQLHDNHEHAGTWIVEYDHRTPDAVLLEELPEEERLAQQTLERHEAIEAVKAAEVAAVAAAEKAKLHAVNAALAARQQEQHQQGAAGSPTSPTKKPESPTKKKKAADDAAASKKPAPAPVVALTRKIFSAGMELLGFAKEETKLLVAWGNRLYRNPDRKTVHVDSISKTIKAMEQFKLDAAGALALRRLDQTMRHLNLPLAFLWAGADSRLKIYAPALRKTMKLVSAMKSPLGNEDRMVLVYVIVTRPDTTLRVFGTTNEISALQVGGGGGKDIAVVDRDAYRTLKLPKAPFKLLKPRLLAHLSTPPAPVPRGFVLSGRGQRNMYGSLRTDADLADLVRGVQEGGGNLVSDMAKKCVFCGNARDSTVFVPAPLDALWQPAPYVLVSELTCLACRKRNDKNHLRESQANIWYGPRRPRGVGLCKSEMANEWVLMPPTNILKPAMRDFWVPVPVEYGARKSAKAAVANPVRAPTDQGLFPELPFFKPCPREGRGADNDDDWSKEKVVAVDEVGTGDIGPWDWRHAKPVEGRFRPWKGVRKLG